MNVREQFVQDGPIGNLNNSKIIQQLVEWVLKVFIRMMVIYKKKKFMHFLDLMQWKCPGLLYKQILSKKIKY